MAFEPSYNILDKDTHNMIVEAFKSGGIGYTEADGTVHKLSGDYVEGGGGGGGGVSYDAVIKITETVDVQTYDETSVYTVAEGTFEGLYNSMREGNPPNVLLYWTQAYTNVPPEYADTLPADYEIATYRQVIALPAGFQDAPERTIDFSSLALRSGDTSKFPTELMWTPTFLGDADDYTPPVEPPK